ncbi:Fic family protein [Leifsonia sp. Root112D2]|uniref:Fic family protein n=1 Tax=Leifsonia sp. Root112D2 TaxID=1736426 RepID=UPI0006F3EC2F|nr:Fic family protein [Leifsonia sp. Root112D2]KQV06796.1 addiction module protein [Leifsonia sp. Root112D2]
MTWHPNQPYNELPPLPPAGDIETKSVLKATVEARAALASLDQAARRIPNPTVLINAIPLLEAQASSEIENIVTTADDLFRFADDEAAATSPETKETLRYRSALFSGIESLATRPLSVTTAIEVCSNIHSRDMGLRRLPGTFIGNPVTKQAIYTPPTGENLIRDKLSAWEQFIHSSPGLDPIVRMALAHYQFEAIHPFADGNGRTGRILNVLLLIDAGVLNQPILYLSRYVIENRSEYYRLLLEVTAHGAWEEWVLFIIEGLRQTATSTVRKIDAIHELQVRAQEQIRRVTSGGANKDLLDVMFEQPYCRISNVMDRCGVSRPTATGWLNALVDAGALHDMKMGRERLFINVAFLDLLTSADSALPELDATLF